MGQLALSCVHSIRKLRLTFNDPNGLNFGISLHSTFLVPAAPNFCEVGPPARDVNCPQHIHKRFPQTIVAPLIEQLQSRIVKLTRRAEGAGELDVYFDPAIATDTKLLFARFVHEHLKTKANDIVRLRHYVCPVCHTPVRDRETAMKMLAEGKKLVFCLECEKKCVPLWDELEDRFASDDLREAVRLQAEQGDFAKSNESKERALVGEVISAVALAGQLSREFSVSDKGLDMEIELNDDDGDATGQRPYLQLKSGDKHLTLRKRDGAEVFQIKDQRHVSYWMN